MGNVEQNGEQLRLLIRFMEKIKADHRIGCAHISLYAALLTHWEAKHFEYPLTVYSREVMPLCKIAGKATYHRSMKDLHAYGYLVYMPSYNHFKRSQVYFN